jgi:small-conductance mechanosensitive channel
MEAFFKESSKKSKEDVREDRALIRQNYIIEEIKTMGQQARTFLKKGFDSTRIDRSLKMIMDRHQIAKDGVFENTGTAQSSRNLTVSYNILNALSLQVQGYKKEVDRYQTKLTAYRLGLDSLSSDESLFVSPKDSTDLLNYVSRLRVVALEISPIIKQLRQQITLVHQKQTIINLELMRLESDMEEIQFFQSLISRKTFEREFVNIWDRSTFERPMSEILYYSITKAKILSWYYLRAYWGRFILFFLGTLIVTSYIYSLRNKIADKKRIISSMLLSSPLLSGLLIGFGVCQFIFPSPPFIFNILILTINTVLLCCILKNSITKYWLNILYAILLVFVFAGLDNLILQPSRSERWVILCLTIAASLLGMNVLLKKKHHKELREEWILFPIGIMVIMEIASLSLTIFGRFNLAKALLISGLTNVIVCIVFLWILRLVNEGLQLASSVYNKQERRLFYINYNRVGQRAPTFFYLLLIVGWFILFARNFYEFRFLTDPIRDFFESDHQLGNYHFSFYNLAIFFVIMILAMVVSKVVSFFASDSPWNTKNGTQQNRFKLGSWILLIRIAIIMIGFFLAFSVLGIPIEQIGIVIGALGVGIGFGLQTLVNNLVSGLILAFEKPVNVDDQVEIGDITGKVKSIGFRSSVITTYSGADLILPNGDLLNAHVLNWTIAGGKKRIYVSLEVKYGMDLDQTSSLLKSILNENPDILPTLGIDIQFTQVSAQAVGIEAYFWIKSSKNDGTIKSSIYNLIYSKFSAENIQFALPKQEYILDRTQSPEKEA